MLSTHPTHPPGFVFLFYSAVYYLLDVINNTMMQRNSQNCKAVKMMHDSCNAYFFELRRLAVADFPTCVKYDGR